MQRILLGETDCTGTHTYIYIYDIYGADFVFEKLLLLIKPVDMTCIAFFFFSFRICLGKMGQSISRILYFVKHGALK